MAKKVKIIGYAKREFYDNGIEYRNFADNLVGNQLATDGGTPLFTLGNFVVTTNLDPRLTKNYRTSLFSRYYSLSGLDLDDDKFRVLNKESKELRLNLDKSELSSYAYFGSLKEFIRVSLENIITNWPASINVVTTHPKTGTTTSPYAGIVYDSLTDTTEFTIDIEHIINKFSINFKSDSSIQNTFNEGNNLRDLNLSSSYYVITTKNAPTVEYPVIDFTGYTTGNTIYFKIKGNLTLDSTVELHIKPNEQKRNVFYQTLSDFESHLLNRKTNFKADFRFNFENDNGVTILGKKTVKWPVSDGYNIDFDNERYVEYAGKLVEIAEKTDDSRSNLINNMLISDSILEFDTLDQKMSKTLNIYGRNFDEIKRQTTALKFAHSVSYDKKNNIPDSLVKNLARTMGWELTTSLFNIDMGEDFLTTDGDLYLSPVESEIEFWRRLILNTPWVWKSKGTRKAIEFLLRFFGTPTGLININEYVYVGDTLVDIEEVREVFELMGMDFNESEIPVDSDGYPKVLKNNGVMYYQKGGHWYRQTGGQESSIDLSTGNNPHIGPYDGGLEYISQFNPVVPNFEPFVVETPKSETTVHQGYLNYGFGKFDDFYNGNVRAEIDTNLNFSNIYSSELARCTTITNDCTVTTHRWNLEAYLDGVLISDNQFFSSFDASVPTATDYATALEIVRDALGISSTLLNDVMYLVETLADCEAGSQLIGKNLEIRFQISFDYDCPDSVVCNNTYLSEELDGLILFQNNATNTVPTKECCRELGFTSDLVSGGFNCYNSNEGMTATTDVYVFMCANSVTAQDAAVAKSQLLTWHSEYKSINTDHTGDIYFIPISDERWLDYPNKVQSGNITVHNGTGWGTVTVLPPNLNTVSWVPPTELMVIALIDEANSLYHGSTPTLSGQPTSHFLNNYKTFAGNVKTNFSFFKGILYPVIKDTAGQTASFILHNLAAMEGTTLTADEINKLDCPVDLSVLQTTNIYENYPIPNSSPQSYIRPLREFNWSSIYESFGPANTVYSSESFIKEINKLMIINQDDNIYTVDSTDIDASETDIII